MSEISLSHRCKAPYWLLRVHLRRRRLPVPPHFISVSTGLEGAECGGSGHTSIAAISMASPRPSLSNVQSPPSSRTSLDVINNAGASPSVSRAGNAPGRRNRTALRDYYGLRNPSTADASSPTDVSRSSSVEPSGPQIPPSALASLDREGFDAGSHVRQVLENEPLQSLLALENELVSEIRNLDGERKALVYDNYSKLISATDTIKKVCLVVFLGFEVLFD
jgi:hypothetical protein